MRTVLVTGGAGYIGSHTVKELKRAGYNPVILDNLVNGHISTVEALGCPFVLGDLGDRKVLNRVFSEHRIDSVIHFAAYAYVGESVMDPLKYYRNNVGCTLELISKLVEAQVPIVFSSTCAAYGVPKKVPIDETQPSDPINPYGWTKLTVERMLRDCSEAHGLKAVALRYFNAAGADPEGELGEKHDPETHIIPLTLDALCGRRQSICVFGDDYDTPDGTCVRDYIHVTDLARAHIKALERTQADSFSGFELYNLGTGSGNSVLEIICACQEVTGLETAPVILDRRPGDPPVLVADATKANHVLGWTPEFTDIRTIVAHAWAWHKQL
ncbi:MAG: UDP-glucose 4-epimerase GalE [Planctomycetes bacterium]|nr:UDP-glucose 4-epimerase GalE [Planctomycetota bacterium]